MDIVMDKTLGSAAQNPIAEAAANTKFSWRSGPAMKQDFTFPDPLICYVAMYPSSPKCYLKMAQSCKFFFETNPILIRECVYGLHKAALCSLKPCNGENLACGGRKNICKLWITRELDVSEYVATDIAASICQKLYRSDIIELVLDSQKITLDDLKLLASSVKILHFVYVSVMRNDERSVAMLEEIFGSLPKIEKFHYTFNEKALCTANAKTLKNISMLSNFSSLKFFCLEETPSVFPVEDLAAFIKDHKNLKIWIWFGCKIFGAYKTQLDQLIDTIIESKVPNRMIKYYGQNYVKLENLRSRYHC